MTRPSLLAVLMSACCLVGSSWQLDLRTIITASTEALLGGSAKENMEVLQKHFFTEDKMSSIWPLTYNATVATSAYEYGFDELVNIERDATRLAKHLKLCMDTGKNIKKATCLANILTTVKQIVDDTTWRYDDEVVMDDIAKQIHFFVAIRSMLANSLRIVEVNLPAIANIQKRNAHEGSIRDFFKVVLREIVGTRYKETAMPILDKTWEYARYWRKDQVSAVEVCQQRTVMWKDFTQGCETRWRRSNDEDKEEDEEEETKEARENRTLKDLEVLKKIEEKVSSIGGTLHDTEITLTGTVKDTVTGEKIFTGRAATDGTTHKGDIMEEFVRDGNKAREKYVKKLGRSISDAFSYIDVFTKAAFDKLSQLTENKNKDLNENK